MHRFYLRRDSEGTTFNLEGSARFNLYSLQLWLELRKYFLTHQQDSTDTARWRHRASLLTAVSPGGGLHSEHFLLSSSSSLVTALLGALKIFYCHHRCCNYLFQYCLFLKMMCVVKPCVTGQNTERRFHSGWLQTYPASHSSPCCTVTLTPPAATWAASSVASCLSTPMPSSLAISYDQKYSHSKRFLLSWNVLVQIFRHICFMLSKAEITATQPVVSSMHCYCCTRPTCMGLTLQLL